MFVEIISVSKNHKKPNITCGQQIKY